MPSMRRLVILWIEAVCLVSIFYIAAGRIDEAAREVDNFLRELNPSDVHQRFLTSKYCQCVKYDCGCCVLINLEELKIINTIACVNVSYLPDEFGFNLAFSLNRTVLYNKTVSAKNPPPICIAVPYLKKELSLCVDLHDLDVGDDYISGCVRVEAHLLHIIVKKLELGCFKIPLYSVAAQHTAAAIVKSMQAAQLENDVFK